MGSSDEIKEVSKEISRETLKKLDEAFSTLATNVTSLSSQVNTIQDVLFKLRSTTEEHLDVHENRLDALDETVKEQGDVLKGHDTLLRQMAATNERMVNAVSIVILTTERTEKKVSGIDAGISEIKDLLHSGKKS